MKQSDCGIPVLKVCSDALDEKSIETEADSLEVELQVDERGIQIEVEARRGRGDTKIN